MGKKVTIEESDRKFIITINGKSFVADHHNGIPRKPGLFYRIRDLYYAGIAAHEAMAINEGKNGIRQD